MYICTYIQYFKLLLSIIMPIKYFKTLELLHFQIKIPRGGKPKPRRGECSPVPPERNPGYVTIMHKSVTIILAQSCRQMHVQIKYSTSTRFNHSFGWYEI